MTHSLTCAWPSGLECESQRVPAFRTWPRLRNVFAADALAVVIARAISLLGVTSTPHGASFGRRSVAAGEPQQGGAGPVGAGSLEFVERGVVVGEPDREAVAELLRRQVLKRLLFDELSAERGDVDASAIRSVEHAGQGGPVALGG